LREIDVHCLHLQLARRSGTVQPERSLDVERLVAARQPQVLDRDLVLSILNRASLQGTLRHPPLATRSRCSRWSS
jgi:hypothetical protein